MIDTRGSRKRYRKARIAQPFGNGVARGLPAATVVVRLIGHAREYALEENGPSVD
jgi:hypothetical protein